MSGTAIVGPVAALRGPAKWAYRAYRSAPRPLRGVGESAQRLLAERAVRRQPLPSGPGTRLLFGPLNTAGQGYAWASAARRRLAHVDASSMSVQGRDAPPAMAFENDIYLTQAMQLHGAEAWRSAVLGMGRGSAMTHVLCESGRPVLGQFHRGSFVADLDALRSVGARVGLLFHGSDIRLPSQHAGLYPHSPFRDGSDHHSNDHHGSDYHARLERAASERLRAIADFGGPTFVSTPDLLDFVPQATWLPLSVDIERFADA
ncbi:MAG: hypothetical protein WA962_12380, partial [Ornithinimicrobium sp.]